MNDSALVDTSFFELNVEVYSEIGWFDMIVIPIFCLLLISGITKMIRNHYKGK